jgi:hypothetical protein
LAEPCPRILFVPVSGPYGMGEFSRSAAIARAVLERWPRAAVHFMVSRQAPYAARIPFPATLLPSSPTLHTRPVIEHIRSWRPDIVIFDNAGRGRQIRAAHRLGARVVYISSRRRQRGKAFRLSWMRALDEHWIAYPRFIAGDFGVLERVKLALLGRPVIRWLDVIMARGPASASVAKDDVLVIPGGGTRHPGSGVIVDEFLAAARALAASGFATSYVGPASAGVEGAAGGDAKGSAGGAAEGLVGAAGAGRYHAAAPKGVRIPGPRLLGSLPQPELAQRMRDAKVVVVNGGSTLLQAIGAGAACVAAPIAGDQLERIRRCAQAGVARAAAPERADIERQARSLLADETARAALARRAAGLGLADGLEVALGALERWIPPA